MSIILDCNPDNYKIYITKNKSSENKTGFVIFRWENKKKKLFLRDFFTNNGCYIDFNRGIKPIYLDRFI